MRLMKGKENRREVFLVERCHVTCRIIDKRCLIGNLAWAGTEGPRESSPFLAIRTATTMVLIFDTHHSVLLPA